MKKITRKERAAAIDRARKHLKRNRYQEMLKARVWTCNYMITLEGVKEK